MDAKRLVQLLTLFIIFERPLDAQITIPNEVFLPGQVIAAAPTNSNFGTLGDKALNRAGGAITGQITINSGITVDGIDISAFLIGGGHVRAGTAGTVGTPAFSRTGETSTGSWFSGSELRWSLTGVEKLRLHGTGLQVAGGINSVFNSSGKIPGITTDYFTNLSVSTVTFSEASFLDEAILARNAANETITGVWQFNPGTITANTPTTFRATWNNSGITFVGLLESITNTASDTQSKMIDVKKAGATYVDVRTNSNLRLLNGGTLRIAQSPVSGYFLVGNASGLGSWTPSATNSPIPSGMFALFENSYALEIIKNGPQGYWKLTEPSGTTAVDSSGFVRDGTYTNTPTLGVVGALPGDTGNTAVTFDSAQSEYITMGDVDAFEFSGARTIEFWLKRSSAPAGGEFLVSKSTGTVGWRVKMETTGALTLDIRNSTDTAWIVSMTGSVNLANGQWRHIVALWDGTTDTNGAKIYADNVIHVQSTAAAGAVGNATATAFEVARQSNNANYFNGSLDEVAVYNFALTATQVADHYARRLGCPNGWALKSDSGNTYNAKMVRGGATFSGAGGGGTHTHSIDPSATASGTNSVGHTHTANPVSAASSSAGESDHDLSGNLASGGGSHTHTFTTGTDSGNILGGGPDFVALAGHTHTGTSGSTSIAHTHGLGGITDTSRDGSHSHSVDYASTTSAGASTTHTHSTDIGSFASGLGTTDTPAYVQTVVCRKD